MKEEDDGSGKQGTQHRRGGEGSARSSQATALHGAPAGAGHSLREHTVALVPDEL